MKIFLPFTEQTHSKLPQSMSDQYIKYEPRFRVMICRLCDKGKGIGKNRIGWHYRKYHKKLALHTRKDLIKYGNNFDLYETDALEYPNTIIQSIEELEVMEGVRCSFNGCNYACVLATAMSKHCTKHHDWTTSKGIILTYMESNYVYRSYVDSV